jgi:hypothetical protein
MWLASAPSVELVSPPISTLRICSDPPKTRPASPPSTTISSTA